MPGAGLAALAPLGTDWQKEFPETPPYLIFVLRITHTPSPLGFLSNLNDRKHP